MTRQTVFVALFVVVAGCSKSSAQEGAVGTERGACRADKTCDPGLLCLSNLCVAPPPADCAAVSELIASFDLGNYAEPEERAPVVAKYKAACEKARVSKEQGECIDKAHDRWTAAQCAPLMFPEMKSSGTDDCKQVADKVRASMAPQVASYQGNAQMLQFVEESIKVMHQSCVEDKWPDMLKKCMIMSNASADAMQACNQQMPPEIMQKLQARIQEAMQRTLN